MAKAQITTKNGATITIQGTPKEVAELITALNGSSTKKAGPSAAPKLAPSNASSSRPTLVNLIAELIDGGFFKKPKGLGAIKVALEEHGYFYPVTTLSPSMLRFVKKRQLRRIKEGNRWAYVG